jgi:hypothetical protein
LQQHEQPPHHREKEEDDDAPQLPLAATAGQVPREPSSARTPLSPAATAGRERSLSFDLHTRNGVLDPLLGVDGDRSGRPHKLQPLEHSGPADRRRHPPGLGRQPGRTSGQKPNNKNYPNLLYCHASPPPPPAGVAAGGARDRPGHSESSSGYCSQERERRGGFSSPKYFAQFRNVTPLNPH